MQAKKRDFAFALYLGVMCEKLIILLLQAQLKINKERDITVVDFNSKVLNI